MVRTGKISALFASLALVAALRAQSSPAAPATTEISPAAAPRPAATTNSTATSTDTTQQRTRHFSNFSSGTAAALAATMPKFTPPPPKPEPKPEEENVDLRDVDKPKNTIVRLPKMYVTAPKPAVFTERDANTQKGLADIAMRRYITDADRALNRFTLPLFGTSAESRAMTMYREDQRLKDMGDMSDLANMADKSNPSLGGATKQQVRDMYLRDPQFSGPGLPKQ